MGKNDNAFDKIAELEAKEEKELAEARLQNLQKLQKRRLDAKTARELADNSTVQLLRVYKIIREAAEEGICYLEWDTKGTSEVCFNGIVAQLKADGYRVDPSKKKDYIKINW